MYAALIFGSVSVISFVVDARPEAFSIKTLNLIGSLLFVISLLVSKSDGDLIAFLGFPFELAHLLSIPPSKIGVQVDFAPIIKVSGAFVVASYFGARHDTAGSVLSVIGAIFLALSCWLISRVEATDNNNNNNNKTDLPPLYPASSASQPLVAVPAPAPALAPVVQKAPAVATTKQKPGNGAKV